MITIVGMGYGENDVTLAAVKAIREADKVYVRSAKCASSVYFSNENIECTYFDDLYEEATDFDALNQRIITILTAEEQLNVVYCVSGSGTGDSVVQLLLDCGHEVSIIAGVDYAHSAMAAALVGADAVTTVSADTFVNMKGLTPDTDFAFCITEIDDALTAGEVKLRMSELFGDDTEVFFVWGGVSQRITVAECDRMGAYDYSCSIVVPRQDWLTKERYSLSDLLRIIYDLRAPDGCPWDKVQTHDSIRSSAVEEAYELVEAVQLRDIDKMVEESGDVVLQGFFHAIIAEDDGEFTYTDMLTVLCQKLIFRHPHVFGDIVAHDSTEALASWESAKSKEKKYANLTERMDGIATTLPPTTIAYKLQKIARKGNFDWQDSNGALEKIYEEIKELMDAPEAERESEGGDLLFAVVNLLRHLDVDPDLALNRTNAKFRRRFAYVEQSILSTGRQMKDVSLEELDRLWNEAKKCGL